VSGQPVVPRLRAKRDIEAAVDHYLREAGGETALAFIDAVEQAFVQIGRHPGIGSLRYAYELDLPGLRCWPLRRHPYLIFYVERDDYVDVWRLLHGASDVPAWMK